MLDTGSAMDRGLDFVPNDLERDFMMAVRNETVAIVWDNLGPTHRDRIEACATHLGTSYNIVAIEMSETSDTYRWVPGEKSPRVITLFAKDKLRTSNVFVVWWRLLKTLLSIEAKFVFLCNYDLAYVTLAAYALRVLGRRVYLMVDAKLDDRPRSATREFAKQFVVAPYNGAISASPRTREYLEFLGMRGRPILPGYDTVSNKRLAQLAEGADPNIEFEARDFLAVARLVPKKNLATLITAFSYYVIDDPSSKRDLRICGDGPLEQELKRLARTLGIGERVHFTGFLQAPDIAKLMAESLTLLLVSTEEQFGNVVPEALAVGTPVIVSDVCGSRYELVKSGVNGLLVEPDNPRGIAFAMSLLASDELQWSRMSAAALSMSRLGDAFRFAEAVEELVGECADGVAVGTHDEDDAYAPIAVFAYKRPSHLARCLDALAQCPEFGRSQVFVFIDGPKTPEETALVAETRAAAQARKSSNVTIVVRKENRGLASSIIAEVTELSERFGRVIVIEDDLLVEPGTLTWLNRGLQVYADDDCVMQISAYQYHVPEFKTTNRAGFQRFATTWGWATWQRAWVHFDPLAAGWEVVRSPGAARIDFDAGGSYPFSEMLVKQMSGHLDSWGIRWSWAVHKRGGLALMPPRSFVRNDGFGTDATHNSVGGLKRFTVGKAPYRWATKTLPRLPASVDVRPGDQMAFRRGLRRTGAARNVLIKRTLMRLGFKRFA